MIRGTGLRLDPLDLPALVFVINSFLYQKGLMGDHYEFSLSTASLMPRLHLGYSIALLAIDG